MSCTRLSDWAAVNGARGPLSRAASASQDRPSGGFVPFQGSPGVKRLEPVGWMDVLHDGVVQANAKSKAVQGRAGGLGCMEHARQTFPPGLKEEVTCIGTLP